MLGACGGVVRLRRKSGDARAARAPAVVRRDLAPHRLALVGAGATGAVIVVAADVQAADLAAVLLHIQTAHAISDGVAACTAPYCGAVERWRPAVAREATASA